LVEKVSEVGDMASVETYVDGMGSVVDVSDLWWVGVAGKVGTATSS